MPVIVAASDRMRPGSLPEGFSGGGRTLVVFDRPGASIHAYRHALGAGEALQIGASDRDCCAYVWRGDADVAGVGLPAGSSLIVESSGKTIVCAGAEGAELVMFLAHTAAAAASGNVHLLPANRVPRYGERGATRGGMHANAELPTSSVWLHENSLAAPHAGAPADAEAGIHSHSENEVIFVTAGGMWLGNRLYGPGTALGITADTLYGFTPGPDGVGFINFRPSRPGMIRFKNGAVIDEVGYWKSQVPDPAYITLPAA